VTNSVINTQRIKAPSCINCLISNSCKKTKTISSDTLLTTAIDYNCKVRQGIFSCRDHDQGLDTAVHSDLGRSVHEQRMLTEVLKTVRLRDRTCSHLLSSASTSLLTTAGPASSKLPFTATASVFVSRQHIHNTSTNVHGCISCSAHVSPLLHPGMGLSEHPMTSPVRQITNHHLTHALTLSLFNTGQRHLSSGCG